VVNQRDEYKSWRLVIKPCGFGFECGSASVVKGMVPHRANPMPCGAPSLSPWGWGDRGTLQIESANAPSPVFKHSSQVALSCLKTGEGVFAVAEKW